MSSERLTELRIENRRLKDQVQDLENKVLSLVGMIDINASGGTQKKDALNNLIIEFLNSSKEQINIVSPKIDRFYTTELKKLSQKGIPILLITRDRRLWKTSYQSYYDDLKSSTGINIINNPNVLFLLIFNTEQAIYSGGSLDKEELEKSILITTVIKEKAKLRKIAEIFSLMLPSFMRK
ncbi:MAG: hypothetical protein ACTSPD_16705 [Promethearchaeota archaeon]